MFISLPFGTFLLSLLSVVLIALVIVLFCLLLYYFPVCSHRGYCHLAAIVSLLGLPCHSSLLSTFLFLAAIIIAVPFSSAVHFVAVQLAMAFHTRLDLSFVGLLFLVWSCHRHIDFTAKDIFVVTTGCPPPSILFCFSSCGSCHHFLVTVPTDTVQPGAIHIL